MQLQARLPLGEQVALYGLGAFTVSGLSIADPAAQADLSFTDFDIPPVFPVLYRVYDQEPLGTVTIKNDGEVAVDNVEVRLDMESYIDNPKLSATIDRLEPGEERTVALAALFNEDVRSISEGDQVAAEVTADFRVDGSPGTDQETVSVEFYDRNAIRWDDDKKIAAFVTTRDTELQPFVRPLASAVRRNRIAAVSENLQMAMMMFNALLEAVGVPTAFLTIPGHIFSAFRLDMNHDQALATFRRPDEFIFREDEDGESVWVPFEVTLLEGEFVDAWATGARQWREYAAAGRAQFFSTAEAWESYVPVSYTGDEDLAALDQDTMAAAFSETVNSFVRREIADREITLRERIEDNPENVRLRNRLGALYARFGLSAEAKAAFEEVLRQQEYAPSLANLGNLAFLDGDLQDAQEYYERALDVDDDYRLAILGIARVSHSLENYGTVRRYYDQLKEVDPALADQFAFLELRGEAAARASDAAQMTGRMVWGEEE